MEIIILVGTIFNACLLLVFIISQRGIQKEKNDMTERLGRFEVNITKGMNQEFEGLKEKIEEKLTQINLRVNERLDENFEKTNRTFTNVLERLSRIDEAQKKIESLSTDIVSLQNILTDKKSRGIYGEVNLKHILSNVFG